WYNGLRVNQGAYGNGPEASKTYYPSGVFYDISLYSWPTNAGDVFQWPEASQYPTNREMFVWATVTREHFEWGEWIGDLSTSNNPANFFVTTNMVITGLFAAISSNTNGVPNWWLALYGIETNQAGADGHADADGHVNWMEYYAGTIPTNSASVFILTELAKASASRMALSFESVLGKSYIVESATNIVSGNWTSNQCSETLGGALIWNPVIGSNGTMIIYVESTNAHKPFRMKVW
ncbi:MAG: hypothetical protein KKD63_16215, partial [Proteobacteria bacterium]|nr:hypothetical protein [Pseudomonadota bacterium]